MGTCIVRCIARPLSRTFEMSHFLGRQVEPQYLSVTWKDGAETWACYEGKCPICMDLIDLGDRILGVRINGQDKSWDCKTMCGKPPEYVLNDEGVEERVPCVHLNELHWVHHCCYVQLISQLN